MRPQPLVALAVAIALAVAGFAASQRGEGAQRGGSADVRAAGLRFDATVAEGDRQAVLAAIAVARPDARRLIDVVDGMVDVRVGALSGRAIGLTEGGSGAYVVTLDLGTVARRFGVRGLERLVLHELGHVIDHALVAQDLAAELDRQIPAGVGCEQGTMGGCAIREERFAETFAKWALGDIGVNLDIGYKIPPPSVPLATWGAPLMELAE